MPSARSTSPAASVHHDIDGAIRAPAASAPRSSTCRVLRGGDEHCRERRQPPGPSRAKRNPPRRLEGHPRVQPADGLPALTRKLQEDARPRASCGCRRGLLKGEIRTMGHGARLLGLGQAVGDPSRPIRKRTIGYAPPAQHRRRFAVISSRRAAASAPRRVERCDRDRRAVQRMPMAVMA